MKHGDLLLTQLMFSRGGSKSLHSKSDRNSLVSREIDSSHVPESATYENVRGEMLLSANSRQADTSSQRVGPPFEPKFVWVAVAITLANAKLVAACPEGNDLPPSPNSP
jgi:hypothetical protein